MYRGQSGHWSWLLHRITGLGVLLFLLVHIVDITLIGFGPTVYNDSIKIFSLPFVRVVSLALSIICFIPMAFFVMAPVFGFCPQGLCDSTGQI